MSGGARPGFEIAFVCLGNLCRSPMAEGIARDLLAREYSDFADAVTVSSAGLAALVGEPATVEAVEALAANGIDISEHRARSATAPVLASAGLVLAMEDRQRERLVMMGVTSPVFVLSRLGEAAEEAFTDWQALELSGTVEARLEHLTRLVERIEQEGLWSMPDFCYDIPDPMGLTLASYEEVAGRMELLIEDIFRTLFRGLPPFLPA